MASMTENHIKTGTGEDKVITFLYKIDGLFNQAMIYSSYKAESMKTEGGGTMLEEYAITQDEKQLFLVMLEEAVHDCGMRFRKLSHGLITNGGIFFNTNPPETIQDSGTAESGTANTLTDSDKSWEADAYNDYVVKITAGTGSGQERTISDTTTDTLTVASDWDTQPDATSEYEVVISTDMYCGFRINDQENYNGNMLDYVAKHAESYMINFVLYKWYNTRNLMELSKLTYTDMQLSRHNLEQSLFQFYKPLINP